MCLSAERVGDQRNETGGFRLIDGRRVRLLSGSLWPDAHCAHHPSPPVESSTVHTWPKSHLFSHGPGLTTSWLDSSQRSPDYKERTRIFCLAVLKHGWTFYFQEDISVLFMVSKSMNFLISPLKQNKTGFPAGLWGSMKPVCSMRLQGRKALEKALLLRTDIKSANVIGMLKSLHGVTSLFLKCNSFILSKFFKRHLYF